MKTSEFAYQKELMKPESLVQMSNKILMVWVALALLRHTHHIKMKQAQVHQAETMACNIHINSTRQD